MNKVLQEIERLAGAMVAMTGESGTKDLANGIIALCEKQEVKGKVITNPIEQWSARDYCDMTMWLEDEGATLSEKAKEIQEILTRPKEKQLWAYWTTGLEMILVSSVEPGGRICKTQTTNAQIKEIGVLVEDWQELADRGEL